MRRKTANSHALASEFFSFCWEDRADSLRPNGTEQAIQLVSALTTIAAVGAAVAGYHFLLALVFAGVGGLWVMALPTRVHFDDHGVEWRNYWGRHRSFAGKDRHWWGRRARWDQFRKIEIGRNPARSWLRARQGENRLVLRARGYSIVHVFSASKIYSKAERLANHHRKQNPKASSFWTRLMRKTQE